VLVGGSDLDAWAAFLEEPAVGVVMGILAAGLVAWLWWKFYRPIRRKKRPDPDER
jgi:hypothetical protein